MIKLLIKKLKFYKINELFYNEYNIKKYKDKWKFEFSNI
jgi:hypothetical protein